MSDRYKITVEEDNSSDAASWIIIAALIVSCFIFIGIPLLIGYIIYRIIKHNRQQKAMAGLKCPTTEQTWRHYEKCRFCGAIQYWDDKKEV